MNRRFSLDVLLTVHVLLINSLRVSVAHGAGTRNFEELFDIGGGRKMYLDCHGSGSPTVVLVRPQLVVDAIREVVEAVRKGRRTPAKVKTGG